MNKYVIFFLLIIVSVAADVVTKRWAENNLASYSSRWEHPLEIEVSEEHAGKSVTVFCEDALGMDRENPDEFRTALSVYRVREEGAPRGPLLPDQEVQEGDLLQIRHHQQTVVPGFWNHIYVQNFGAAWGMFSERNESFRRPFFLGVSIVAVIVVFGIFMGVKDEQWLLTTALALIVGGALGNFIDRVRYGYVVDFIDWYITTGGDEKHWPTFNVADIAITIGVALMIIELLFGKTAQMEKEKIRQKEAEEAAAADGTLEEAPA